MNVLIKPVSGACNLRCTYCFYFDEMANRAGGIYAPMTEQTAKAVIRRALTFADGPVTFAFQGGEPTLAGADFYRHWVAEVNKRNHRGLPVTYALQTNGYHLEEDLLDVLHDNRFLVGVSLDGTQALHDRYRRTANGQATHEQILNTISKLKDKGIDYNVLCVVDKGVAIEGAAVYEALKRHGYLQFIPCMEPLEETGQPPALDALSYGRFLVDLFDRYEQDFKSGHYVSLSPFDNWIQMLRGLPSGACGLYGVCFPNYLIESDGSVYPCDFYALDDCLLGNVNEESFYALEKHPRLVQFLNESRKADPACLSCRWLTICRGGCKRERQQGPYAPLKRNRLCEGFLHFFNECYDRLQALANIPVTKAPVQT